MVYKDFFYWGWFCLLLTVARFCSTFRCRRVPAGQSTTCHHRERWTSSDDLGLGCLLLTMPVVVAAAAVVVAVAVVVVVIAVHALEWAVRL